MRIRDITGAVLLTLVAGSGFVDAQTPQYYVPLGPPATLPASKVADLSGDWQFRPTDTSSVRDPGGSLRGQEPDVPYRPETLKKLLAEVPAGGRQGEFEKSTDPSNHYCEPRGVGRILNAPAKVKFVQTPEAVYILHELGPVFRVVWLNAKHPEDPDPTWWGHSVGWYENGDTLVVDTVGFNDRTWLHQHGHPHTERLHYIERYRRADNDTLEIDFTIDDPGAYTGTWQMRKTGTRSTTGFMRFPWVCSVRDNYEHYEKTTKDANSSGVTSFEK